MGMNESVSDLVANLSHGLVFRGSYESLEEAEQLLDKGKLKPGDVVVVGCDTCCYTAEGWDQIGGLNEDPIIHPIMITHCSQCGAVLPVENTDSTTGVCKCSYCSSPNYVWGVTQ